MKQEQTAAYWRENIELIVRYLIIWFVASYGCGILFVDELNKIYFFGFKMGFWFAQQGSIFIFLALLVMYARNMNRLDKKYDVDE